MSRQRVGLDKIKVTSSSCFGRGPLLRVFRAVEENLASIVAFGPIRALPSRFSLKSGGTETRIGGQGVSTTQILADGGDALTEMVSAWFKTLEIPYELRVEELDDEILGPALAIRLFDTGQGITVSPADVGIGISQLLPILVAGISMPKGILCVEQPELHLHPRLQANLADFLIGTSVPQVEKRNDGSKSPGCQWIVETHSEAL